MKRTHTFTEADQNFKPIPAGLYKVQIMEINWVDPAPPKNGYYKLKLMIDSGEHTGRFLFLNTVVTPEPQKNWMLKKLLKACDFDVPSEGDGTFDIEFDESDIIGYKITVSVVEGVYNDKPKNEVKDIVLD